MAVKKAPSKTVKKAKAAAKKSVKTPVKKTAVKKSAAKAQAKKPAVKKPAAKTQVKKPAAAKPQAVQTESSPVSVKEMSGGTFVIVVGTARLFFTLEEMRTVVRLCHLSGSEADAAARMFTWFSVHRSDVLKDIPVKTNKDPVLGLIYQYLVSHYDVKKD